jgi:CheY-like chemotaxis protein
VFDVDLDAKGGRAEGPESPAAKILVVDDARFFRELIVDVLKPLDVPVKTAADAETALATARRECPALIILDLNLPTMDGYDLIRALRADEKLARIRILAMSGVFRKDEDVAAVQRAGADDFTSKSFKPEQFLERVRKMLGV